MKLRYILPLSALALVGCEDFTEHNFGKAEELFQATEVQNFKVELGAADYKALADNKENKERAAAADAEGLTSADLVSVGEKGYFRGNIDPTEYLFPMIKSLVGGANQYYALTEGSSITIQYKVAPMVNIDGPAYVPAAKVQKGKYLIVPQGVEQPLATSGLTANGDAPSYGYLYLAGGDKCPETVTRLNDQAIAVNANAEKWLYSFQASGSNFYIENPDGMYLYLDGTHASFQYSDDISDLDDPNAALWSVTPNEDGTFDITNVATEQVILYSASYSSAGAYSDKKGTDGYLGVQLYGLGTVSEQGDGDVEDGEVTFSLERDEETGELVWNPKGDYLNQELLGVSSVDADNIYETLGWSIEFAKAPEGLSYVWSLTSIYGLKASAYKNQAYASDSWLISPVLNLKKAKQPIFTFAHAQKYAGTPVTDWLKIYVSTDYAGRGQMGSATWTEVTDKLVNATDATASPWPDGSSWDFMDVQLPLEKFAGQPNVFVAFRYISTGVDEETGAAGTAATWELKNVVCKEAE